MTVVMVAIFLPVLVLLTGLAVDTGLWWVHKRHLQTQADAAALAGASEFRFPCDPVRDTLIEQTALTYSGAADIEENPGFWPTYNKQLGRPRADEQHAALTVANTGAPVHARINEGSFWGDRPPDEGPDVTEQQSTPCTAKFVDVKLTEERTPGFFARLFIDHIDAQARVELKGITSMSGLLPIGVEEVNPTDVHVWMFDEETGSLLDDAELEEASSSGALLRFNNSASSGGSPIALPDVRVRRIGITVALSGSEDEIEENADFAATCLRTLVVCYGTPTAGISRIRGFREESTEVHVRAISLVENTCSDTSLERNNGYFSTECDKVEVRADIRGASATTEFAVTHPGLRQPVDLAKVDGIYRAVVPLDRGTGNHRLTIQQQNGEFRGVPCLKRSPCPIEEDAHAPYSGSRLLTGPIKHLSVDTVLTQTTTNNNNVRRCVDSDGTTCPESFVINLGVEGRLELRDPAGPPVSLRVFRSTTDSTGNSLTQQLDCDFDGTPPPGVREEYATGCRREYVRNRGQYEMDCPNNVNDLPAAPAKLPCVPVKTGKDVPKPTDGLRQRFLCLPDNSVGNCPKGDDPQTCTNPNSWNLGQWQIGDPRVVPVFLVPFGSFNPKTNTVGGGSGTVPVVDFATFYVTAWEDKDTNPCRLTDVPLKVDNGEIWGHFTQYSLPNLGGASGECQLGTVSACTGVMTK